MDALSHFFNPDYFNALIALVPPFVLAGMILPFVCWAVAIAADAFFRVVRGI